MSAGTRGWLVLTALLAVLALALHGAPRALLDWQPQLALDQPWRALTAAGVHYSTQHLVLNLAGAAVLAALGALARPTGAQVVAWVAAWPLTHWGLALRPELAHYGGLSGVLHAGAAIVAVGLLAAASPRQRGVGAALLLGLLVKVLGEAPWGPVLRHPAGTDFAVAPLAHATGLLAGLGCGLVAITWSARTAARAHG